jgi:hypothetical protein
MSPGPDPSADAADAAAQALAEIRQHQDQVISGPLVPTWFWAAVGVLVLVFFAAIESRHTLWVIIGSIGYALGLGAIIGYLVVSRRFQLHSDLLGVRGTMAIITFALVLTGIGLGLGFGLEAAGVVRPATFTGVFVAAGMAFGGPLLMRYLITVMRSRAAAPTR